VLCAAAAAVLPAPTLAQTPKAAPIPAPAQAATQAVSPPQADSATLRARLMQGLGHQMPADAANLDAWVRQNDMAPLTERLRQAHAEHDVELDLNWEQVQVVNGAGFVVGYAYMFDLWRLGSALPAGKGEALKQTAAMMFLYNLDLIAIDGAKCADASAPVHRRDQLFDQNPGLIAYMRTLPRATRMSLGSTSLEVERATAPLRKNDEVLCSGGVAQITQGLQAAGNRPLQPVPNTPGTIGKTYAVPPAPGYKPAFVAAQVWVPKQAETRKALPASLTNLLTLPTDAGAAKPTG
jgi:hypothetical protein